MPDALVPRFVANIRGLMDDVEMEHIKDFEAKLMQHLRDLPSEALKTIRETGKLEDDTAAKLTEEIEGFKAHHWKAEAEKAGKRVHIATAPEHWPQEAYEGAES